MKNNIYGDTRTEIEMNGTVQNRRIPELDSLRLYEKTVEVKN